MAGERNQGMITEVVRCKAVEELIVVALEETRVVKRRIVQEEIAMGRRETKEEAVQSAQGHLLETKVNRGNQIQGERELIPVEIARVYLGIKEVRMPPLLRLVTQVLLMIQREQSAVKKATMIEERSGTEEAMTAE